MLGLQPAGALSSLPLPRANILWLSSAASVSRCPRHCIRWVLSLDDIRQGRHVDGSSLQVDLGAQAACIPAIQSGRRGSSGKHVFRLRTHSQLTHNCALQPFLYPEKMCPPASRPLALVSNHSRRPYVEPCPRLETGTSRSASTCASSMCSPPGTREGKLITICVRALSCPRCPLPTK